MCHLKLPKNALGRDFVIGDLHGNLKMFECKLIEIGFDDHRDRMFSVGDLIDRGESSKKCLELTKLPWFYSVLGNHEDMAVKSSVDSHYYRMWMENGGDWAFECSSECMKNIVSLIEKLPYSITIDDKIGITHAEAPYTRVDGDLMFDWNLLNIEHQNERTIEEQILWGRSQIKTRDKPVLNIEKTYHGHTPSNDIVCTGNSYFIDTGACWEDQGGYLTCLQIN